MSTVILPFPAQKDREAFANKVTGFTDGEGSFSMYRYKKKTRVTFKPFFAITLRADDYDLLVRIQSFFGCGCLVVGKQYQYRHNPAVLYTISKMGDLKNKIVPHFEKYPLESKKLRDFNLWKQGVDICYVASLRYLKKYTDEERTMLRGLCDQIREVRKFKSQLVPDKLSFDPECPLWKDF